jgi:protein SCO1/2
VGLAVACVLSAAVPALAHQPGRDARLPTIGEAPAFALTTADGGRLALADLRGKVAAVTFIYAACTDTCPLLTAKLAALGKRMGKDLARRWRSSPSPSIDATPRTSGATRRRTARASGLGVPHRRRPRSRTSPSAMACSRGGRRGDVDPFLTSLVDRTALRVSMGVRFDPDEMLATSAPREGGR